jgi:hypothetical protein
MILAHFLIANEDMYRCIMTDNSFRNLNRGEYADIEGSQFTNGNLYVRTSKSVSAYQSIGF